MKKYLKVLENCPLFSGIASEELLKMLVCLRAKMEVFDKKYTIIAEGSQAKFIGIVLSGSAQISQVDYDGNRSILGNIYPSEVFSEAFACAKVPSIPVSIIANEETEVMLIDSSHILSTCENACGFHKKLIYNLMIDLAKKTISFHQKLEILSKRTTREKLLSYLSLVSKNEGSRSFKIPFNRQELADYLEVDRSGLSNEISKLREEGILESHKNKFTLL